MKNKALLASLLAIGTLVLAGCGDTGEDSTDATDESETTETVDSTDSTEDTDSTDGGGDDEVTYYKLGNFQAGNGNWDFFAGETSGNYLAVTQDFSEAADLLVTEYDDGFSMQIVDEDSSINGQFITLQDSANYIGVTEDEESALWYIDETYGYICKESYNGTILFICNYNSFDTFSASSYSSYATSATTYAAYLYETDPSAETYYATDVTISNGDIEVAVDGTVTLSATVTPAYVTDATVTWTVGDETVATVEDGVLTGVKVGTTTLTATANGAAEGETVADTVTVTVSEDGPTLEYVIEPEDGTSYKLGMYQTQRDGYYYFTGAKSTNFWSSTTDFETAVDVVVNVVEGGYTLKFDGGDNDGFYLALTSGSTYLVAQEEAFTWTIESSAYAIVGNNGSNDLFIGSNGTYTTFGTYNTSNLTSSSYYIARLYSVDPTL